MRNQIDLLAGYILDNFAEEIGKGNPVRGESAVEVAIRLLGRLKMAEAQTKKLVEAAQAVINEWDDPADGAFNTDVLEQLRAALGTPQESVIDQADAIIKDFVWLWREYVWADPKTLTQDARKLADRLRLVVYDLSESVADLPERGLAAPEGGASE